MSESKQIADHEDALDLYFNEMLVDSTAAIVTGKTRVRIGQAKPTSEYDLTKPFQALLFDINGLQLAIRTEDVKAILPWPETPLEQSQESSNNEAIMGSYNLAANQIKIINTAHIVLPIQHRRNIAIPSFMIVVGDGNWALSCHKINSVIILAPEDIRWRKNKATRPWLAGTSIEKSCSIVNLTGLVNLLTPQNLA
jgi:purine-binding chemotaxis protein CheW